MQFIHNNNKKKAILRENGKWVYGAYAVILYDMLIDLG